MMGEIQKFISGAISKTVNLPSNATVEDIENIHMLAWDKGVKSIAVYRDGCKAAQPLSSKENEKASEPVKSSDVKTNRERMPQRRSAHTQAFRVGDLEGYITVGEYNDGRPGEVFVRVSKQGSTLAGIMDAWSIALSMGLQYGVPLKSYVEKYVGMRFEPLGMTNDRDARIVVSIVDYVARRLAIDYLSTEDRQSLGIFTNAERIAMLENDVVDLVVEEVKAVREETPTVNVTSNNAPLCFNCGTFMRPSGACHVCANCGSTSGCS
jgi:ribonucleoside-diphosphate reductase alpha chain